MPRVTALTAVPKQPGRVAVGVDGTAVAVVFVETALRLGLVVGADVDDARIAALVHESGALRTFDRALRMLAARGRSVRELRRRLLAAKEPEGHVATALARLEAIGALNDEAYARQVARTQMIGRAYAPRRLKQELARRGVAREIADRAIEIVIAEDAAPGSFGMDAGVDLSESIERLARKKSQSLESLDREARVRRLYSYLARRGYDSDDIRRVIAKLDAERRDRDSA